MMYKVSFIYALLFFFGHAVYSQVAIGTTVKTPNPDAMLDLTSTNKGSLLPRVALTSTASPSPLSANVAGMMVYNTATAGSGSTAVSPGIYINDGTQWRAVSLSAAIPGDAIRSALSTSVSAYDAAAVDGWVPITASEYGNLTTLTGAAKHGMTDAVMALAASTVATGTYTHTQVQSGTYALPLIPASEYVFAFAVTTNSAASSTGGEVMISTSITGTYTNVGSTLPNFTTISGINYFVRKRPSSTSTGSSYLAAYMGLSSNVWGCSISGVTSFDCAGYCTAPTTSWGGYAVQIQCISTGTKAW